MCMYSKGMTGRLACAILACVVGTSFQYGYHIGVVNPPESVLESFINQTQFARDGKGFSADSITWLWSAIVSIFCLGGMIGGVVFGYFADRLGRKGTMLLNNVVLVAAVLLMSLSKVAGSYEMLIAGRFIVGVSCGINTGIAPLYLSEIAPVELRGAAGTINQFAIVTAIMIAQILGLTQILGTADRWPYLIGFSLIPAAIQLVTLPFCPETPRYLIITKDDTVKAKEALVSLRGSLNVHEDVAEIQAEFESSKNDTKVTCCDLFTISYLKWPTIISVVLQFSQQFSGINAVIFYSTALFESAGLTLENAIYGTIGVAGVNVVMTFISVILMDRAGRRTLHLYGLAGMWVFSVLITVSFLWKEQWPPFTYIAIIFTIGFMMMFAIGPGSIPWLMVAELFPQGPRGTAMSLAVMCNWFGAFVIGLGFRWMQKGLGNYTFIPFSVLLAVFWIFTYCKVPETKNKTIQEISLTFRNNMREPTGYKTFQNHDD
ncbi:glucose transporter type 1-like isoform X2 [Lineus longissimus]|uniref:glucose transporter type 1-like isoform X2 n=1 Tax=Lineus longissimus TaxID=88925 RepID=UPI002B4F88B3